MAPEQLFQMPFLPVPNCTLAASAVPGTHTGHLTRKGNPFTAPAGKAAVPQKADAHPEAELMDAA